MNKEGFKLIELKPCEMFHHCQVDVIIFNFMVVWCIFLLRIQLLIYNLIGKQILKSSSRSALFVYLKIGHRAYTNKYLGNTRFSGDMNKRISLGFCPASSDYPLLTG